MANSNEHPSEFRISIVQQKTISAVVRIWPISNVHAYRTFVNYSLAMFYLEREREERIPRCQSPFYHLNISPSPFGRSDAVRLRALMLFPRVRRPKSPRRRRRRRRCRGDGGGVASDRRRFFRSRARDKPEKFDLCSTEGYQSTNCI